MMYVGGLKDELPEGYGVKSTEGLKFKREKMGIFSAGSWINASGMTKRKIVHRKLDILGMEF
jgi:hypothetical protein